MKTRRTNKLTKSIEAALRSAGLRDVIASVEATQGLYLVLTDPWDQAKIYRHDGTVHGPYSDSDRAVKDVLAYAQRARR